MEIEGIRWQYDRHELIADGIVHGVGVISALVGVTALIFYATVWTTSGQLAAAAVYGLGLLLSLGISFAYNLWPVSKVKWHLRRFDHSAIFVLIAATYTPFLQRGLEEPLLVGMLVAVWLIAAAGVAMKFLLPGRYDRLAILLYLAMGWSGTLAAGPLRATLPETTLTLILIGGLLYSVGVIFHVWQSLRFQNAIWHGFVVAAAGVHYSAVLTCVSA
ncbi:PAQR family membrane homeostasis protein TrhA [Mycoplana rhizolycopersici]|uniref:Hemolysin III family protein n=1 Tax=Mycoplana rhizolycopersici TaxID=2746702 RepID=A0ABX2QAU7_9HYPH|nr:hemolysin III family protein [Rhizobium rhizolycopersici]NVP54137.1 hemolysin III family protein [Rhizobium rhizolycopersici]